MGFQLTDRVIKQLCGRISYERGESYYHAGKVRFTAYDPDNSYYEALVKGNDEYDVTVEIDVDGDVEADCSCPAFFSYDHYCKHIAAVLIYIQASQTGAGRSPARTFPSLLDNHNGKGLIPRFDGSDRHGTGLSAADMGLLSGMMKLFDRSPVRPVGSTKILEGRAPLDVQFLCSPSPYGFRKNMLGVEMKIGPKRLYVVQKIRDFLERIERREPYVFSKHFTYDPEQHYFRKENESIVSELIQIMHNEKMVRESVSGYHSYQSAHPGGDRMLLIPPYAWERLFPLLAQAPMVQLTQSGTHYEKIQTTEEPVPVHFEFDQATPESYRLKIDGLEKITVLEPYSAVLFEGKLKNLSQKECSRLSELKQMLEVSRREQIRIPAEQVEPFVDRIIPGLMKLGTVEISKDVSDRMIRTPLRAKLYLDRIRDRLLAGLEFHYGEIVINPLETKGRGPGSERILLRDGDKEQHILALLEQSPLTKTDSGYFLDDEDAEYDFLYHTVPELERLLEVYATSAVKARLHTGVIPPKIHVEFDERTDWLEFTFEMDGIPESEIRHLLKSLEEKRRYHKLPGGALMPLESSEFQELVRFLNEVGVRRNDVKGYQARVPVARGMHLIDDRSQNHSVKLGKSFRRLLENMRNPDNLDFPVPEALNHILRDYQKYGYQWLKTLAHYRFGGILADDMGLGKTLQSITFLVSVLPDIREKNLPAIIVSPASLVYNWLNELKKFAPGIRAVIADGSKAERSRLLRQAGGPEGDADVIITSYPLLRRDVELYAAQKNGFHTLFLDEAQAFKNHATQTAQAVKSIRALHRFALTGTPVENRLEELWSIYDAVFPELFPGRKAFNELPREAVARRVRPFLLRRLKSDVLKELPEKIESLQASELLPEQKKLYVAYLARLQQETVKHLNEEGFQKNRIKILAGLTRLRQLCCHPALFVEGYGGSSAKFEQLLEILEECRSAGKRLLIFSQFTEMLGIIGRELARQGVPYFYLDGQTPGTERVELCSRFNGGERDLFLISLKAGGTGLNLTGADTVILYDLWWNPAVEQQAADRAHRIGQKNVVQVIRLVTQGTVEDKMYELQQRKKHLIEEVIKPGEESVSTLTEQEIRGILSI